MKPHLLHNIHLTGRRIILLITLFIATAASVSGQTYYYERIKIVSDAGHVKTCNDDAHYITFNGNKCYDSDAKGLALNSGHSLDYNRTENDIMFYYGSCIYGDGCSLFASKSKDRINLKTGRGETYVYVRTSAAASKATKRPAPPKSDPTVIPTPVPVTPDIGDTGTSPGKDTRRYPGRRVCPGCNGTGHGKEVIESAPAYTTHERYCPKCDKVTYPHSHRIPLCHVCFGKGYVE